MDNSKPRERILHLHFGEIAIIDSNLQNMEELVHDEGVFRPMDRGFTSIKPLLLKISSSYLEAYDTKDEFDKTVPVAFTEGELWVLRSHISIGSVFKGVPIGEELKRKIFEALIDIENERDIGANFSLEFLDVTDKH